MLTFTKQDSIVIAVTLGVLLSVPLLVPAFYTSSNITVQDRATPPLPNDNFGGDDDDSQWRGRGGNCGLYEELPIQFRQGKEGIARGARGSFSETEAKPDCGIDRVAMEETIRQAAIDL
jgi:hypothetical protein